MLNSIRSMMSYTFQLNGSNNFQNKYDITKLKLLYDMFLKDYIII